MQFVHHECRDLGLLKGMWAPPCPHGEGKKQETMSLNGWKRFQFIWWKDPFFLFCFCFSVSFFGLKRETLWDYSKAILFAKKESQRWDSLRTASPHVRVTRWILFFALCRQRSWLIKWAFGPREMRCWELALGREFLLLIRDSSSFFRDLHWQWQWFLALCLRTEKNGSDWLWWTVNCRLEICFAFGLKILAFEWAKW